MSETVHLELNRDHAVIVLNRPERLNAFTVNMATSLRRGLDRIAGRPKIRVVLVRAEGKAFCAGVDIHFLDRLQREGDAQTFRELLTEGKRIVQQMLKMPQIVVSAVNGTAAGGGCCLALAADLRVAATDAQFCQAFIRMGLQPDWGALFLLPRLVGTSRAMELMVSGRFVRATEAHQIGLVNEVVAAEQLQCRAREWVEELLAKPARSLASIKKGLNPFHPDRLEELLEFEIEGQMECFLHPDSREAVRAFLEKRLP